MVCHYEPKIMSRMLSSRIHSWTLLHWTFNLLMLFVLIALFVPLTPKMPSLGLDPSWALGLNQAVAQGLAFGTQIIFTLGPYSSIYTSMYHPATDQMMLWSSAYWACSYWIALLLLWPYVRGYWRLALMVFLLTMIYSRDSLFFSYPLLVGLLCLRMVDVGSRPYHYPWLLCVLLFAPFGLMALIKGSLLILSILVSCLCALLFCYYRKYSCTLLALLIPCCSLCFFWIISGQSLVNVPAYISNSLWMASDFTQAMSKPGNSYELLIYLLASFMFLYAVLWQKQWPWILRIFLFSLLLVFLLLSFKAGFVRHYGHAFIPGTSIFLAALLFSSCLNASSMRWVLISAVISCVYINSQYTHIAVANNMRALLMTSYHGLWSRLHDSNWAKNNFELTKSFLAQQTHLPVLPGTADLYSYEQGALIVSGNTWVPRPIFQSYSVFNASFAQLNRQHLLSSKRPEYLFFKIQPVDQRLPSLEDGSSWPVLLSHYQIQKTVADFLLLHQRAAPLSWSKREILPATSHHLGERVLVPASHQLLLLRIHIHLTTWGRLVNFLFKPQELWLHVELADGTKKEYRFVAEMAASAFLFSPLIEATQEFSLLYRSSKELAAKRVKAFSLVATVHHSQQWQQEYQVQWELREQKSA